MPYRELSNPAESQPKTPDDNSVQRTLVRGISWTLDHDLSTDGLSSNERIVKIMSRNNSEMLSKWLDAVRLKTGKADIARAILKEFHKCGATHRQKAEDMVKGLTAFFKRYESYKEKVEEQTTDPSIRYNQNGDLEFVNVSSFLQAYLDKNFPYYLDITKAFDTLYRLRPDLLVGNAKLAAEYNGNTQQQSEPEVPSSDEESSGEEAKEALVIRKASKSKRKSTDKKAEAMKLKLKKLRYEAEIRRIDAETQRVQTETQEKVLAIHAKYNEPRFVGTEESKAAQEMFKGTFPSLFPPALSNQQQLDRSDSEVDELEE